MTKNNKFSLEAENTRIVIFEKAKMDSTQRNDILHSYCKILLSGCTMVKYRNHAQNESILFFKGNKGNSRNKNQNKVIFEVCDTGQSRIAVYGQYVIYINMQLKEYLADTVRILYSFNETFETVKTNNIINNTVNNAIIYTVKKHYHIDKNICSNAVIMEPDDFEKENLFIRSKKHTFAKNKKTDVGF